MSVCQHMAALVIRAEGMFHAQKLNRRTASNAPFAKCLEGDLAWDPLEANTPAVCVEWEISMGEATNPSHFDISV